MLDDRTQRGHKNSRGKLPRRAICCLSFLAAAAAQPLSAETKTVDKGDLPEFFLGKWTIKGQEATFAEECRLLTKNSYVICEGSDRNPKEPYKWVRLIGYSHFEDLFNVAEYGGDGSFYEFQGWHDAGKWTFVSQRKYENRVVRIEDRILPTRLGYSQTRKISINGGDWETRFVDERIRLAD